MAEVLPEEVLFDSRLIERHIRRGLLTQEQVTQRTEAIPDTGEQADRLDLDHLAGHIQGQGGKRAPTA